MIHTWHRGAYKVSTDPDLLDRDLIYNFLSGESYWGVGRSRELVDRSIDHSVVFGLYVGRRQAGFCRAVTDHAFFAWLADVFVLEEFRGLGLGEWLVESALSHPDFAMLRRWILSTRDAHTLYERFGFKPIGSSPYYMSLEFDRRRDQHAAPGRAV